MHLPAERCQRLEIVVALVLGAFEMPDLIPVPVLRGWIVWLAIGVMTAVGVTAGLVPAWRAARVDPSVTLRAE